MFQNKFLLQSGKQVVLSQRLKTHNFFDCNMVVVNQAILKKEHKCPCTGSAINIAKLYRGVWCSYILAMQERAVLPKICLWLLELYLGARGFSVLQQLKHCSSCAGRAVRAPGTLRAPCAPVNLSLCAAAVCLLREDRCYVWSRACSCGAHCPINF